MINCTHQLDYYEDECSKCDGLKECRIQEKKEVVKMTDQEYKIEKNMLKGNFNRICVSHDKEEIEKMYKWALRRLKNIVDYRINELHQIDPRGKNYDN